MSCAACRKSFTCAAKCGAYPPLARVWEALCRRTSCPCVDGVPRGSGSEGERGLSGSRSPLTKVLGPLGSDSRPGGHSPVPSLPGPSPAANPACDAPSSGHIPAAMGRLPPRLRWRRPCRCGGARRCLRTCPSPAAPRDMVPLDRGRSRPSGCAVGRLLFSSVFAPKTSGETRVGCSVFKYGGVSLYT